MGKIELIVTRHQGLVEYLKEIGLADELTEVISHVENPEILTGKHVCGVLPHHLSCLCEVFTEVPLIGMPAELRGKELDLGQVRQYAGELVHYKIRKL